MKLKNDIQWIDVLNIINRKPGLDGTNSVSMIVSEYIYNILKFKYISVL